MGEWVGVAIALVSSCLGGTAAAITRYLAGNTDPITLAILRWGIGFFCVWPVALFLKARWPQRRDWPSVAALGFCFFGVFFVLYNIAMTYTTAARASLALATLPLHTMVVGALLGIEPLTKRKTARRLHRGTRRHRSPCRGAFGRAAGRMAWRTDHDRRCAVHGLLQRLVPAVHSAFQRTRFSYRRHGNGRRRADRGRIVTGSIAALSQFSTPQWIAGLYLGIAGGALAFILWVLALERASPTRVANTMTVNPRCGRTARYPARRRADHAQSRGWVDRRVRGDLDRDVGDKEAAGLSGLRDSGGPTIALYYGSFESIRTNNMRQGCVP